MRRFMPRGESNRVVNTVGQLRSSGMKGIEQVVEKGEGMRIYQVIQ